MGRGNGTTKSRNREQPAFDNLDSQNPLNQLSDINLIMDIPVRLSVELGRTK